MQRTRFVRRWPATSNVSRAAEHAGLVVVRAVNATVAKRKPLKVRSTGATKRNPLPEALHETAVVPGFKYVRHWGDITSPAFEETLKRKARQVLAAAQSGVAPRGLTQADFLAISGGGDKGAFAAGLLKGWSERGTRPTFEVVTGVSAGALAAPFAFLGPSYDDALHEIYTKNGAVELFKSRGILGFFRDALNDTDRLEELIRHYLTPGCLDLIAAEHHKGRRLLVATTNLDAQRQVIWDLSAVAASDRPDRIDLFVKVLRASSAIPGLFPPVRIDVMASDGQMYDELHVDGGVTAELVFVPPEAQILEVEDQVFPERRKRCLYVIENGRLAPEYQAMDMKILQLSLRAVATMVKYQVIDNLMSLALVAKASNGDFFFNSIPATFRDIPTAPFDRAFEERLYAVGHNVGLAGSWASTPPASPKLGMREAMENLEESIL